MLQYNEQINACDEEINSYTQISIGDIFIPEIDNEVILFIPLKVQNTLFVTKSFSVRHNYVGKYQLIEKMFKNIVAKKICDPNEVTNLSNNFSELENVNYFIKIKKIPTNTFNYDIPIIIQIDNIYKIQIEYKFNDTINITIVNTLENKNKYHWNLHLELDDIKNREVWLAYNKIMINKKSARK